MGSCLSTGDDSEEVGCGRALRARKQRKQQVMEILAAEAKSSDLLYRIPGRMCTNGASSRACIFTQQGRKGTNQDAMVVWENFASHADATFCGVFDGHGPFGHLVARKVRDSLPSKLNSHWKAQQRGEKSMVSRTASKEEAETASATAAAGEAGMDTDQRKMFASWKDSFLKAYNAMDKELRDHPTIDCFCSGTTAVTMLLRGRDLVIGNVGDSRAVLGTLTEGSTMEAVQLTTDLKPNLPVEAERIKRCRGRVFALEDEPEVARVWLPNDDSPGLAMARAFGDFCLKDFGLIAEPEVTYRRLTHKDQFVVLASDGVWDVLSNKEVVDVIWEAPTRTTAARALVETAVRAWRFKYPTSKVDDCAVVCLYLNENRRQALLSPNAKEEESKKMEVEEKKMQTEGEEKTKMDSNECGELERSNTVRSGNSDHLPLQCAASSSTSSSSSSDSEAHPASSSSDPPAGAAEDHEQEEPSEITILPQQQQEKIVERSASRRSLAECLSTADDDDEWSALEGVARVNSLLHLPRFLVGDKRGAAGASSSRAAASSSSAGSNLKHRRGH